MEKISIQIPADLFATLYGQYGDETETAVLAALSELAEDADPSTGEDRVQDYVYPRPSKGTITGRVWEIADQVLVDAGQPSRELVIKRCLSEGINVNTANTQFSHWKKAGR